MIGIVANLLSRAQCYGSLPGKAMVEYLARPSMNMAVLLVPIVDQFLGGGWYWPIFVLGLVDPCLCFQPHSSQGCDVLMSLLAEPWLGSCPAPVVPWVDNWIHEWVFGSQQFGGLIVGIMGSLLIVASRVFFF